MKLRWPMREKMYQEALAAYAREMDEAMAESDRLTLALAEANDECRGRAETTSRLLDEITALRTERDFLKLITTSWKVGK